MNYKMYVIGSEYLVVETLTNQVIKSFYSREKAKKLLRHLNLGGGFDGWTPTFFMKKIEIF